MRLDKFLCETGAGSRAEVKKMIKGGRIQVNGQTVKEPDFKVDENADDVRIDGGGIKYADFCYYMLNKPKGTISASRDSRSGQICVTDLIHEKIRADLFPVGRLDKDTEGLLIITNDGDLAHRLLSPKKHVDKTYFVELDGVLSADDAARIMKGVDIGDPKPTLPCDISRLSDTSALITITEGRYHQIKRMMKTAGRTVKELKRISMGPLTLDPSLLPGDYRELSDAEIESLKNFDKPEK